MLKGGANLREAQSDTLLTITKEKKINSVGGCRF